MNKADRIIIKFDGENNIDLEILATTLNSIIYTLNAISKQVLNKGDKYKFIVKDFERGSFIINIEVIRIVVETLVNLGPAIIPILAEMFNLRKFLKGEPPSKIIKANDSIVQVINNFGEIKNISVNTFNTYINNPQLDKKLAGISQKISKDVSRTGFSIDTIENDEKTSEVYYSRDDLQLTSKSIDVESLSTRVEEKVNQLWLTIAKVDFVEDTKWEFLFYNSKISAKILDKEFLRRIQSGEIVLSAGTQLYSKVKETRSIKTESKEKVKIEFIILEVMEIKHPEKFEQEKLFSI